MKGFLILGLTFLLTFIASRMGLKPLTDFTNKFEYIPIITSNIIADLIIIFITFSGMLYVSKPLLDWYKKYRLSAMIADILIGVIYLLIARYIAYYFRLNLSLFQFGVLAVGVQIFFDFLFYLLFSVIPVGQNDMLDLFKKYAKDVSYNALLGDSILVLLGVIISAWLKTKSFDYNMMALLISSYLVPYIIWMKD